MRRKMVTILLAGLLTAQSVFPAFAEEIAVPEMDAANVETETQEITEQPVQTEAEAVTEQQAVQTENETATEQTAQTETEAAAEQQSAQTEVPDANAFDSVGEDEEELIISSENGSGETVDLDELEAGLMTASDTEDGALTREDFRDWQFWDYLRDQYDKNVDDKLSAEEISAITKLDLSGEYISDDSGFVYLPYLIERLDGIEHLTSLKTLICGNYVRTMDSLDVSENTALTYLDCSYKGLFELNVNGNTNLQTLICRGNNLFDLNISANPALKKLDCAYNHLKKLDVSENTVLEELNCEENELLKLDVSQNSQLKYCQTLFQYRTCNAELVEGENGQEWHLDLKKLFENELYQQYRFSYPDEKDNFLRVMVEPKEGILNVPYGNEKILCECVTTDFDFKVMLTLQEKGGAAIPIDEDHFPDPNFRRAIYVSQTSYPQDDFLSEDEIQGLFEINVSMNGIKTLEGIEYLTALTRLECYDNQLTSLDMSQNTELTYLKCSANNLTDLNVSQNAALIYLDCSANNLTDLNVSQNAALTYLDCGRNQLSNLDASQNAVLTYLDCQSNSMIGLDVSGCTALTKLNCYNNQLSSLDVSGNPALTELDCPLNNLTSLNVSGDTALTHLYCKWNKLNFLDLNGNTNLKTLECGYNQLESLDLSHNTELSDLWCEENQLTSLDLSQNAALTYLYCRDNPLTSVNVDQCSALRTLWCENALLTSLDVSHNLVLEELNCKSNKLTSLDLSKLKYLNCLFCTEQNVETYLAKINGTWKVNIANLVGSDNIDKVFFESEDGFTYTSDGMVEFIGDDLPEKIQYQYDTGLRMEFSPGPDEYLTVNVSLKTCENHQFGEWVTEKESSYTDEGLKVRTCSICGSQEEQIIEKLSSTITFSEEEISLKIGDTISLAEYIKNTQENDPISKWESDKPDIASVNADGTVTANEVGDAVITVTTENGAPATITLHVYCGSPENPDHAYEEVIERWPTCTWDGSAYQQCKDCGKIGSERVLPATGHQFGAYRITKEETIFETGLEESTCSVCGTTSTRVRPKLEPEVQVTEEEISLQIGKTASLETYVTGLQKGDAISAWESDNTGVVSVDENGRATANEVGTAVITVTTKGGVSKKITVRVYCGSAEEPDHTYEEVIEQAATCTEDGKAYQKCTVCGKKKEGSDRVIKAAGHQFGPYEVVTEATVFKSGLEESVCAVCKEKRTQILPRLEAAVRYSQEGLTIQLGETVSVKGYVTGIQNGDLITRWRSFAPNIAKVDADGNVTAMRAGLAYIAVGTRAGAVAKLLVTVEDHTVHTTGISNLHTGLKLEAGKSIALHPVIEPADSQDPVIYGSVAPNIATVSKDGVIKAIRVGLANIYVKSGTEYRKILVRVIAPSLTAITGVRKTGSLYEGVTYQLRPQRYPLGSAGVFYYKSSDPEIASVDKDGKVTAKKKGFTTITVTARGVSTAMRLRVK